MWKRIILFVDCIPLNYAWNKIITEIERQMEDLVTCDKKQWFNESMLLALEEQRYIGSWGLSK